MNHTAFKIVALFYLIGLSAPIFAQKQPVDKKNYALLWEITGNGLAKPSYLFGTMHLRDKRMFEFTDSMFLKFDACEAFVSEVRMDSVVYESWELAMSGDTTNKLSKKLSPKGYERLLKALKKKGINLDSVDSKNSDLVQGWLTEREDIDEQKDSKDLFLDLYLTRLAYNQGKSLHGLERLEDYEDLNDSFFQQFEDSTFYQKDTSFTAFLSYFASMEELKDVYNKGDLIDIQTIIRSQKSFNGKQYQREMLDNRNLRMVQKLEDIMRQKSVFCAVGAAHLPDSMGLITLLRQKGYKLRRVTPQFTGLAEQYKPQKIDREWHHIKDDFNRIELDFPEQPYIMNKLKANNKRLGSQYLYYDITTGAIMLSEVDFYPHLGQKKTAKDQLLTDLFSSWLRSRGLRNVQKEKIKIGESEGYQFSGRLKSKALVKGRYFLENNNIYKTLVFFDRHKEDETTRADAFLKSLKINPLPLTDWQVFEEEKGAFSIKMPIKPAFQEIKSTVSTEDGEDLNYVINLFVSKEAQEGFTYMVRYNDLPAGRYIEDDSFYLSQIKDESMQRFQALKAKIEMDSLTRHYGAPEFNIKVSMDGVTMFIRTILRGNRVYLLLGQPPIDKKKNNAKKLEDWMNSFRFLPFSESKLTKKDFPELGIRLNLPSSAEPPKQQETASEFPSKSDMTLHTTDDRTGAAFVLTRTMFSKYYSVPNLDTFWAKYDRNLMGVKTKRVKTVIKDTLFKGIRAKLVTLDYRNTQNVFKALLFLKDGYQYEYSVASPPEVLTDAYLKNAFDGLELIDNKVQYDIFSSKKQLIINDLSASVDSVREEAKAVLSETEWLKEDLPLLTEALKKHYDDDTLGYVSTRIKLLNQITDFKDASTLTVLEKLVRETGKDTTLRNEMLCAFLDLDTLGSANRFFEIASSLGKFDFNKFYCLNTFMRDSVARARLYYDKMLALSDKPFEEKTIILLSENIAYADTLNLMRDVFVRYTPQYLTAVNAALVKNAEMLKRDTLAIGDYSDYQLISNYVRLFKYLPNTPEINLFLKKLLSTNQIYLLKETALSLLKQNQTLENSLFQRLLKDKSVWFNFLRTLENDSLLSKAPPQYINQKDVAEGCLLDYLYEDYGVIKTTNFIETQKYKGALLYIFKFKIDTDEENNWLIGVCSQPMDKSKYDFSSPIQLFSEPLKDVKTYKKVVEELLKEYESRKTEEDDDH